MTDNQFDKFFRDRLQALPSPVPEDMWSRIRQEKDRDRKIIFFWRGVFPGLLAALILIGGGYYLWVKPEKHATAAGQPGAVAVPNASGAGPALSAARSGAAAVRPAEPAGRAIDPARPAIEPVRRAPEPVGGQPLRDGGQDGATHIGTKKNAPVADAGQPLVGKKSVTENTNSPVPKSADHKLDPTKIADPKSVQNPAPKPTLKPAPKKGKISSSSGQNKWSVDIYCSPDLAITRWRDIDSIPYLSNLLKTRLSYTVGARVSRWFGEHFSGKIGLQYSVINEWYMPDPNGSVFHKRIKTIDIPVFVGYAWGDEEFKMAVNTGMIFNAHTWYSSAPSDSLGDIYKSWLGMSIYLGVDVSRRLNDRIELFAEPYYKYRLSQMLRPEIQVGQKIDIFGVLLGVRYNFKKP